MAKRDNDNFDFEVEGEGKTKTGLNLDFIKNLTKQQKGIILAALVGIVLVIAIVVICIIIGTTSGTNNGGSGGQNDGSNNSGIEDIYIYAHPTKRTYIVGESPNYSGMSVGVSTASGTTYYDYDEHPDMFTISGFDSSVANDDLFVTVEYKGHTTRFKVKILPVPGDETHLIDIELISMPKTEYKVNDYPSFKGGKLLCTYSDASTKEIDLKFSMTSGFEYVDGPSEYTIYVEYEEDGYFASTEYKITVTE